jgi:poly-gamma-glutamate synthesis protein (capsule biosynthesis protein)
MRLILLGDVWLIDGRVQLSTLHAAGSDAVVLGNLETPIARQVDPRPKAGPALMGIEEALVELRRACRSTAGLGLSLANNHMMDYGDSGRHQTQAACERIGIETYGAGDTLSAAQAPWMADVNGETCAVLARCETQFGVASPHQSGVAPLDSTVYDDVRRLKKAVDTVIVSVHGGAEASPWPSPSWQDALRALVDAGADIVHGHHAHLPQGYEPYNGGLIFYGLGNFWADPSRWADIPDAAWSIVAECEMDSGQVVRHDIHTVELDPSEGGYDVRSSTEVEARAHRTYLDHCNRPLQNRRLLSGVWQEVSLRLYTDWYGRALQFEDAPRERPTLRDGVRMLQRTLTGSRKRTPKQSDYLFWYHLFACESHRDAISTALGVRGGEIEDVRTPEAKQLVDDMLPWTIK